VGTVKNVLADATAAGLYVILDLGPPIAPLASAAGYKGQSAPLALLAAGYPIVIRKAYGLEPSAAMPASPPRASATAGGAATTGAIRALSAALNCASWAMSSAPLTLLCPSEAPRTCPLIAPIRGAFLLGSRR
jgi:hypothetical protein